MLQLGEIAFLHARNQPALPFVVLESDSLGMDTGLELILEVVSTKALQLNQRTICQYLKQYQSQIQA